MPCFGNPGVRLWFRILFQSPFLPSLPTLCPLFFCIYINHYSLICVCMGWSNLPFMCCCQRALLLLLEKEDTVRYCNAHYSCSYFRGYDRSRVEVVSKRGGGWGSKVITLTNAILAYPAPSYYAYASLLVQVIPSFPFILHPLCQAHIQIDMLHPSMVTYFCRSSTLHWYKCRRTECFPNLLILLDLPRYLHCTALVYFYSFPI